MLGKYAANWLIFKIPGNLFICTYWKKMVISSQVLQSLYTQALQCPCCPAFSPHWIHVSHLLVINSQKEIRNFEFLSFFLFSLLFSSCLCPQTFSGPVLKINVETLKPSDTKQLHYWLWGLIVITLCLLSWNKLHRPGFQFLVVPEFWRARLQFTNSELDWTTRG